MKEEPRISINKLMEYRKALPSRQREIVDDQKNPLANKPKITWCASARKVIIKFISEGCADERVLDDGIIQLKERIENIEEKDQKKRDSREKKLQVEIDAINAFRSVYKKLELRGFLFSTVSKKPRYLDYSGVHVSVRPEIIVMAKSWEYVGCMKLYLTKNARLEEQDADFLCAVLNHYADKYLSPKNAANPKACVVIDVFGKKIFTASESAPLRIGEIRKNCEDIRKIWATIPRKEPISGSDGDELDFPENN